MADEKKEDAHVVVEAAPAVSVTELLTLLRDQAIAANRREEESARREERLTALLDGAMRSSADARAGSMTAAGVGSGPIAGSPADGRRPPVESVGPGPRLHEGISLQEFGTWETRVRAHARRARWDSLPIEEQTAALLALLDDNWTRTLQHGLDIATPNTCENLVAAFRKHLRGQRSVVLDRREFFMRQQEPGETFDDYLVALKELAQFCDFCVHCRGEQFRDRLVNGISDQESLQAMLAEPELTLEKAIKICRANESAKRNAAVLRPATVQAMSAYRRGRSLRRPSPAPASDAGRRRWSNDGSGGSRSPAPRSRGTGTGRPTDHDRRAGRGDRHHSPEPSDRTCGRCGRRRHSSGAEVSYIGPIQAEQLGVDPRSLSAASERFYAANGQELQCNGQFACDLSLGDRSTSTTVTAGSARKKKGEPADASEQAHLSESRVENNQSLCSVDLASDFTYRMAQSFDTGRHRALPLAPAPLLLLGAVCAVADSGCEAVGGTQRDSGLINIQSLLPKILTLEHEHLDRLDYDICVITETWLPPSLRPGW
ncbi:hypothetical protein FJT64_023455 [Amphibalanus amphitrite]|uniref:Retrotransposon gag domain-containing protein n=1 Tax=Amphibalanus amphitrite TaxID=1232801 RepID=A0A6A4WBW2_AMPAM|nr:hypothetical protein FJT64_023455 [Amphibalanus amphitrite]